MSFQFIYYLFNLSLWRHKERNPFPCFAIDFFGNELYHEITSCSLSKHSFLKYNVVFTIYRESNGSLFGSEKDNEDTVTARVVWYAIGFEISLGTLAIDLMF